MLYRLVAAVALAFVASVNAAALVPAGKVDTDGLTPGEEHKAEYIVKQCTDKLQKDGKWTDAQIEEECKKEGQEWAKQSECRTQARKDGLTGQKIKKKCGFHTPVGSDPEESTAPKAKY